MATLRPSQSLPRALKRTRWHVSTPARPIATAAPVEYSEPDTYVPETIPPPNPPHPLRRQAVREAKPFSDFLTDTFNRQHDYLRISVTERCNLRCLYCMPEEGIQLSPSKELLTSAEIYYLSALFVNQGVTKIRLTGGEPTVRKDIVPLMQQIGSLRRNGLKELALTTNGISLHRKLDQMVEAGLTGVNISLDTLDPFQFQLLTRRQGFDVVMKSIRKVQEMNKLGAGIKLKVNCVVMRGLNDHQILPFVDMTQEEDIEVRFIEYMPFGGNKWSENKMLPYAEMLDIIRTKYPTIGRMKDAKNDTSKTWQVPGFKGRVGFITSMTHNFCGTCNRLRITSDGNLKVCLHGNTEVSLRDLLRADHGGEPLDEAAFDAIKQLELDRRKQVGGGLRLDGEEGWISKERQLLEFIGAAVKRKKAKHAGMGALENMTNRPMILIGEQHRSRTRAQHPPKRTGLSGPAVPFQLLSTPRTLSAQLRLYSSDSRHDTSRESSAPTGSNSEGSKEADAPGLASTFGFQSLSRLFHPPSRGRYSTPRPTEERARPSGKDNQTPSKGNDNASVDQTFFRPTFTAQATQNVPPLTSAGTESDLPAHAKEAPNSTASADLDTGTTDTSRTLIRKHMDPPRTASVVDDRKTTGGRDRSIVRRTSLSRAEMAGIYHDGTRAVRRRNPGSKRPNPFASTRTKSEEHIVSPSAHDVERPWGISEEDMRTIQSIVDPSDAVSEQEQARVDAQGTPAIRQPKVAKAAKHTALEQNYSHTLTHVNTSGEAHMVDVGAKPASRRVAIAFAIVRFSNSQPFRLILENNNKKGDVLGTARIAGIMATKRASELIPLCHPIAISRVELDVKLEASGGNSAAGLWTLNKHGLVTLRAEVECVGPTGVEMEALTAVTAAALTVYDMCKAVDRDMVISSGRVVYKSGGRSGTHWYEAWSRHVGDKFFEERGLSRPEK